jgi:hypothetical protein
MADQRYPVRLMTLAGITLPQVTAAGVCADPPRRGIRGFAWIFLLGPVSVPEQTVR